MLSCCEGAHCSHHTTGSSCCSPERLLDLQLQCLHRSLEEICDRSKVTIHSCNSLQPTVQYHAVLQDIDACLCVTTVSLSQESTLMHTRTPGCACSWHDAQATLQIMERGDSWGHSPSDLKGHGVLKTGILFPGLLQHGAETFTCLCSRQAKASGFGVFCVCRCIFFWNFFKCFAEGCKPGAITQAT